MTYIKTRILNEVQKYKQDTSTLDKIVIWISRAFMIFSAVYLSMQNYEKAWLVWIHVACCFLIEILHLFSFQKSFINKISYSLNAHMGWFIAFCSSCYHLLDVESHFEKIDWVMHLASGFLTVYIGFYIIKTLLEPKTKAHNQVIAFFSFCFANFTVVGWEIFEFISDYMIGSNNQRFDYIPDPDSLFFQIIGMGNTTEAHWPLFDTMFDSILAFLGASVATCVLYIILSKKLNKSKKVEAIKPQKVKKETTNA